MLANQAALAALNKSFNALFLMVLDRTQTVWERIATRVPSTTAQNDYAWMGDWPMLREWIGDRHIKGLQVHDYAIKNKKFEATIGVKEDDIDDDNLGVYGKFLEGLAENAKQHPDKLVFDLLKNGTSGLCYDGQYFFDTDHPQGDEAESSWSNYATGANPAWYLLATKKVIKPFIFQERRPPRLVSQDDPKQHSEAFMRGVYHYGVDYRGNAGYALPHLAYCSKLALDETNFFSAKQAMSELTNSEGEPLEIVPDLIVVPPSLDLVALKLFKTESLAAGGKNPAYNNVEVLVAPRLAV